MKQVTGIGRIFFQCDAPQKLNDGYGQHPGLSVSYGTLFKWRDATEPSKEGETVRSPFKHDTAYFAPSDKSVTINYRVEQLVTRLKNAGVVILDEIAVNDYSKFVHVLDPEGNRIELWEDIG